MRTSRPRADGDRYEVWLWRPVHCIAFLTPVIGLALASLLSGAWQMALVCVALGAMWTCPSASRSERLPTSMGW